MWARATVGSHYGIFEVMGVELYKESDTSFILYGYLPRSIPEIPVSLHESLRGGMTHIDFVKIHEFLTEAEGKVAVDKFQALIEQGAPGVFSVTGEKRAA
ncbi:MAG: hypothetical protein ACYC56_09780 [Candidatus Aquicultor sp.]